MAKKHITITIDDEIWFQLRCQDINISGEVNDFLKARLTITPNKKKEELLKRLSDVEEEQKRLAFEKQALNNKLNDIRKKEDKKHDSEVNATLDSIRASGILAK